MSIRKPPPPPRIRPGAWCAGSPSRTGTPLSCWGCCARCGGRCAEVQSDIDHARFFIHIHDGLGVAQVVEEPALLHLAEEVIRILRVESLAFLHRPKLA